MHFLELRQLHANNQLNDKWSCTETFIDGFALAMTIETSD